MPTITTPRILIAGERSGVGKSAFVLGLSQELRRRGLAVSVATSAPDLGQALIFKRYTGRPVLTLSSDNQEQSLFAAYQASLGADILLIDGYSGLFDRQPFGPTDFELATALAAPIILVCDASSIEDSIAAVVHGFVAYSNGHEIAPVFSKCTAAQRLNFSKICKEANLPPLLGVFPKNESIATLGINAQERRGRVERGGAPTVDFQSIKSISSAVKENCDVDEILASANAAAPIDLNLQGYEPRARRARIAVSDDACFGLHFQNNSAMLNLLGADLLPFSPLIDPELPEGIGAVYLTGGFFEAYADDLANNRAIASSIRNFVKKGGVLYAEGSGALWLFNKIKSPSKEWTGLGLVQGSVAAVPNARKTKPQQTQGSTLEDSILGEANANWVGLDPEEWVVDGAERVPKVLRIKKDSGAAGVDGYSPGAQVVASLGFVNFSSNLDLANALVDSAQVFQNSIAQKSPGSAS